MGIFSLVIGFMLLAATYADGDSMNINIQQPNAQMYHQQSAKNDQFTYGYHVDTVSDQFQHKVKGPDDVTYGCYGYIDPSNRKHLVYYVADRMGYRIIFPNRPTKIYTAQLSDSLNKLDGSLKGKSNDEKVVAWNDLYLPDSCFRLGEILTSAASAVHQQVVSPVTSATPRVETYQPDPEPPRPTQYTIPPTPPRTSTLTSSSTGHSQYRPAVGSSHHGGAHVSYGQDQSNGYNEGRGTYSREGENYQPVEGQQTVSAWSGSLPDINPAHINLDQFNINAGYGDSSGSASTTQFTAQQYSLNMTQLLAQIEAVNAQVITFNMLLAGMASNPTTFSNANEGSCKTMVQLLRSQKTTPQLVYVPIMIPYVEGQHNVNQPIQATAGRYQQQPQQQQQPCRGCKG